MRAILGSLFLWLFVHQSVALYPSSSDVVDLTPANFDRLVLQGDAVWVVEFYAPWCGHCKSLVPEYQKAATALKGAVKVGAMNADEHKSLAGEYGVRGFPTLKIFGANKKSPIDYSGQRTADAIAEAALAEVKKKENDKLKNCLTKWYQDEVFKSECRQIYLDERTEFRRTGIMKKHRNLLQQQ
uniref:protein disulfide-isomerase n=1 Tax=Lutzomyia longipalpis TaxID=7200 RepID=A0A1B0CEJ6_LUTLO